MTCSRAEFGWAVLEEVVLPAISDTPPRPTAHIYGRGVFFVSGGLGPSFNSGITKDKAPVLQSAAGDDSFPGESPLDSLLRSKGHQSPPSRRTRSCNTSEYFQGPQRTQPTPRLLFHRGGVFAGPPGRRIVNIYPTQNTSPFSDDRSCCGNPPTAPIVSLRII